MAVLETAAGPMSHPGVAGRATVMETIVDAHSGVVLEGAEANHGAQLERAPELWTTVVEYAQDGGGWSPPFGAFEVDVRSGAASDVVAGAARIALWAHDHGVASTWRASFPEPAWLRFGDQAVEQLTSLEMRAGRKGYEARGRRPSGEIVEVAVTAGESAASELGRTTFADVPVRLSERGDLPCLPGTEFLAEEDWKISGDFVRGTDELARAEELLQRHSPSFLDWVRGVLRQVVFTDPGPGLMESGSNRSLPGFVHVSHGEPAALAEMLTHELSHQYYYLATRLGPVEDGTDKALYWSPVKQTGRPIANILLAYHAFGNVLLLMRELLHGGATPAEPIETNAAELTGQLLELQQGLEATTGLTEIGLGLYEPLRDALQLEPQP